MEQLLPDSQIFDQQQSNTVNENKEDIKTSTKTIDDDRTSNCDDDDDDDEDDNNSIKFKDWGLKVDRLFDVAYRFYKRNESKAFHPTFDTRNQMNALILQARYGNFDGIKAPDVGLLDLVGKNRRHQWSLLKGMSKTEAMSKFILTLDQICPFFKAHAEAVKISVSNTQSINSSDQNHWPSSASTSSKNSIACSESQILMDKELESDDQLKAVRTSLNRQTYDQFKSYAEKQYPDDIPKRKYLISTLQEQYYQQYISQMHPEMSNNRTPSTMNAIDIKIENNQDANNKMQPNSSTISTKENNFNNQNNHKEETHKEIVTKMPNNSTEHLQSNNETSSNTLTLINSSDPSKDQICIDNATPSNKTNNLIQSDDKNDMQYEKKKNEFPVDIPINDAKLISIQSHNKSNHNSPTEINLATEIKHNKNQASDNCQQQNNQSTATMFKQNILPQDIGKFESYPAPKPIQNVNSNAQQQQKQNSLISVAINMFNPLVTTQASKQQSVEVQQHQPPASTTISSQVNVAEEAKEQDLGKTNSTSNGENGNSFFKSFTKPLNDSKEQLLEQLPIPFQPLPSPPIQAKAEISSENNNQNYDRQNYQQQQQLPVNFPIDNRINEATNHQNFVHESQMQPTPPPTTTTTTTGLDSKQTQQVDTWSCGSSEGRESPLEQNSIVYEPLEPATLWTKKGCLEFRESLVDDKHGGMHIVNQGALVTIQVPTYPDGRYIQWEFCTEDFDIAFGLDFVYDSYLAYPLSLRIYEETDTEDEDDEEEEEEGVVIDEVVTNINSTNDIESAGENRVNRISRKELLARKKVEKMANTISIVPTYRRESHEEVFIGRHRYPGQGYYLLKFDNTYSVLRSKTLFFRICYLI